MKITIELAAYQIEGLKLYLQQVGNIDKPTIKDIQKEIDGIVQSELQSDRAAYSDYIVEPNF